jgi:predicted peroxiredoxin
MSKELGTMIVLTTGKQDRGTRATLAFSWGCAALAMGQTVAVYLTMDGTVWASKGAADNVSVAGFETLDCYIEQFLALGGEILVCAPCSEYYCSFTPASGHSALLPEAQLVGLATIVSRTGQGTKIITF